MNVVSEFGVSTSASLVTTPEADDLVSCLGKSDVGSLELLIADANGEHEVDLVPVYGVTVNANLIVQGADLDPDEVADEATQVLRTHFAERGKDVRAKARSVADFRVNVYTSDEKTVLALNVLASEAYRFAAGTAFTTMRADADPTTSAAGRSEA